jgi:iron complex outermembrane receptor protein
LLNRTNFDLSNVKTKQQMAAFILGATLVPGARDNGAAQIGPIANGGDGGFAWSVLGVPLQQVGSSEAKYGDFRIGLEHDLNKDQMVYAKISTGHKAGGFNDAINNTDAPITYKPEKLTVFEAGSRNAFNLGGHRTTFNVTGFYYDYKDQVLQDLYCQSFDANATPPRCNGFSLINRNIASSKVLGVELESRLNLTADLRLDLNAAFLKTKINSGVVADSRGNDYSNGFKAPTIDLAGNELPLASKVNLTARLFQKFALGAGRFDWQALVNYRSDYFLTQFNERDLVYVDGRRETAAQAGFPDRQKGYSTVNFGIGYEWASWRIEGFAANLTNVQSSHREIASNNLNLRFLSDARTYGIRLRNSF